MTTRRKMYSAKDAHFIGVPCRKMKPTRGHRPALWENMLGTVRAMNDAGEVRYFDYNWDEAIAFSGANDPDRDARLCKNGYHLNGWPMRHFRDASFKQKVLFILKVNRDV